mmetsp:Transcript_24985/g.80735  ORF Transcript_24985/g.80735 Transcript_24985/m.80735 type:complete len:252 (+) Transcript_24985:735-1490(+)
MQPTPRSSVLPTCPSPSTRSPAPAHAPSRSTRCQSTQASPASGWAGPSCQRSSSSRTGRRWRPTSTGSCAPSSTAPRVWCSRAPWPAWTTRGSRRSTSSSTTTWATPPSSAKPCSTLGSRCTAAPTPRTSSSTSRASLRGRCSPRSWRRHRSSPSPEPDSGPVGRASSASPPSRRASPARKHASVSPRFSADQAGPWLVGLKAAARVKICIIDGTHPATPPLFAPPTGRSDLGPPLGARGRVPWIRLSSVL